MKVKNYLKAPSSSAYIDVPQYVSFDSEQIPSIKSWRIGERYKLELTVEEMEESKDEDQEDVIHARFKIIDVGVKGGDLPKHIKKLVQ